MGKKVLRYTEDEFVTLLENIVNRVKKEQQISESTKAKRKPTQTNPRRKPTRNRNSRG